MSYSDFLRNIENLENQIKLEHTGTAEELADKLCFSRRTLFNYFDLLEEKGLRVKFCRFRKTYYFDESSNFSDN
jgi:predicted DNA-binding transcriptional regulator YafY